jgi:hypothetical protein
MPNPVRKYLALTGDEKKLLATCWWQLLRVRMLLYMKNYKKTRAYIDSNIRAGRKSSKDVSVDRICYLLSVASRWVPSATCLVQAVTAEWMLKSAGYHPLLHIGVKKQTSNDFEAHAWLELDGERILGGSAAEGFSQIYKESGHRR